MSIHERIKQRREELNMSADTMADMVGRAVAEVLHTTPEWLMVGDDLASEKKTKAQQAPYPLRISDDLRAVLEACAKAGRRSLNAEIVMRLERSVQLNNDWQKIACK